MDKILSSAETVEQGLLYVNLRLLADVSLAYAPTNYYFIGNNASHL